MAGSASSTAPNLAEDANAVVTLDFTDPERAALVATATTAPGHGALPIVGAGTCRSPMS